MELWNIPNDDLAVRLTEHLGKAWRVAAAAAASAFALSLLSRASILGWKEQQADPHPFICMVKLGKVLRQQGSRTIWGYGLPFCPFISGILSLIFSCPVVRV